MVVHRWLRMCELPWHAWQTWGILMTGCWIGSMKTHLSCLCLIPQQTHRDHATRSAAIEFTPTSQDNRNTIKCTAQRDSWITQPLPEGSWGPIDVQCKYRSQQNASTLHAVPNFFACLKDMHVILWRNTPREGLSRGRPLTGKVPERLGTYPLG